MNNTSILMSDSNPDSRSCRLWLLILLILISAALFPACRGKAQPTETEQKKEKPPATVIALPAKKANISIYLTGLGSVTPLNTVTVRSRVDGQLMELLFKEGQTVTKGALLATIDPRPFQVQLSLAQGQMSRDQELLKNSRLDLERYKTLWAQSTISKQQLDTQEALVHQYDAAIKIDQGQIDSAKLNLTYSRVTAPISGRVGLRQVDPGNMVRASDPNGLIVINQLQPVSAVFTLPEDNLPQVLKKLNAGEGLLVEAYDRELKQKLATGTLLALDNQIDPATGTVKLKAIFPNEGNELFPNQFINIKLFSDVMIDAIIVPAAAIQRGPQGTYVYVVKADNTVEMRPVKLGATQGGDCSISEGLANGERVVVEGTDRLREGSKVNVKDKKEKDEGGSNGRKGGKRRSQ